MPLLVNLSLSQSEYFMDTSFFVAVRCRKPVMKYVSHHSPKALISEGDTFVIAAI